MANDCIPLYKPGKDITAKATGTIEGKRFCAISADFTSGPGLSATAEGSIPQVARAGAGVRAFGVAPYDLVSGDIADIIRGGVVPVTAGGTVTFGQQVEIDSTGRAVAWAGTIATQPVGMCINGATVGNDAYIALY